MTHVTFIASNLIKSAKNREYILSKYLKECLKTLNVRSKLHYFKAYLLNLLFITLYLSFC